MDKVKGSTKEAKGSTKEAKGSIREAKGSIREARVEVGEILQTIILGGIPEMEETWEWEGEWVEEWVEECTASRHGIRTHSTNKDNRGVLEVTNRCLSGRISSTVTFLQFSSREVVESAMVAAQLIIMECLFLAEFAIVKEEFVLNAMEEELTSSMASLVANVKAENGRGDKAT